jgi:hypothetical protein
VRLKVTEALVEVTFSRRNLVSILAKLDGHPPDSACTIFKGPFDGHMLVLRGESDDVHYRAERPGLMHPETERIALGQAWVTRVTSNGEDE